MSRQHTGVDPGPTQDGGSPRSSYISMTPLEPTMLIYPDMSRQHTGVDPGPTQDGRSPRTRHILMASPDLNITIINTCPREYTLTASVASFVAIDIFILPAPFYPSPCINHTSGKHRCLDFPPPLLSVLAPPPAREDRPSAHSLIAGLDPGSSKSQQQQQHRVTSSESNNLLHITP
jgi:hypothetical protein